MSPTDLRRVVLKPRVWVYCSLPSGARKPLFSQRGCSLGESTGKPPLLTIKGWDTCQCPQTPLYLYLKLYSFVFVFFVVLAVYCIITIVSGLFLCWTIIFTYNNLEPQSKLWLAVEEWKRLVGTFWVESCAAGDFLEPPSSGH